MTKEQFLKLQPYEWNMLCAKSDYLRSAGRIGQQVAASVYAEIFDKEPPRVSGCGSCEFQMWHALQRVYFEYKEQMEAQPEQEQPSPKKSSRKAKAQ